MSGDLNYKEMRKAVENEQALMKFMLALPPDQFQVGMHCNYFLDALQKNI